MVRTYNMDSVSKSLLALRSTQIPKPLCLVYGRRPAWTRWLLVAMFAGTYSAPPDRMYALRLEFYFSALMASHELPIWHHVSLSFGP